MNTNKKLKSALDNFIDPENEEKEKNVKKVQISGNQGIIERIDRIFITESGKQLLREQY
jgi:hypothetical protein